uniref:Uncharacterized protein n=1 Tax=Tetraselmis sp. GSL018 TaxID=582737 RepID=A0A061RM10_9CHLO
MRQCLKGIKAGGGHGTHYILGKAEGNTLRQAQEFCVHKPTKSICLSQGTNLRCDCETPHGGKRKAQISPSAQNVWSKFSDTHIFR